MSGPTIRRSQPADADAVGTITEAAYRHDGHLGMDGGDAYAALLRDAAARMAEATVLVAELDGVVVGSVTVAPSGTPWANVARPGELEVRMLGVAAAARRRGVAEALMVAVEEHARSLGLGTVVLSTSVDMFSAQRLYERLGYRLQPDRDWSLDVAFLVSTKAL